MKKYFYILLLLTFSKGYCQKVEIFTNINFGTITNIPLKTFHNELVDEIPFKGIKTTDNFNINYGLSLGFKVNSINTSFFYTHKVSGSKSSLSDFSGHIVLTNEIKGSTLGGLYEKVIKKTAKGDLYFGVKGIITFSKLSLQNKNSIVNNFTNETINFKSIDFGTGLVLTFRMPIGFFIIKPFLGLDVYYGGKLKLEDAPKAHLVYKNGNVVKTGWTGINGGIGIAIPIF